MLDGASTLDGLAETHAVPHSERGRLALVRLRCQPLGFVARPGGHLQHAGGPAQQRTRRCGAHPAVIDPASEMEQVPGVNDEAAVLSEHREVVFAARERPTPGVGVGAKELIHDIPTGRRERAGPAEVQRGESGKALKVAYLGAPFVAANFGDVRAPWLVGVAEAQVLDLGLPGCACFLVCRRSPLRNRAFRMRR